MPIPLGILAAAGSRQAAATFQLLESTVLGSSQNSIEFTNLTSKYAATYQHLQIRMVSKSSAGVDFNIVWGQFNGDTANNYSRHNMFVDGTGPYSNGDANQPFIFMGYNAGVAAGFGAAVIDILDVFETTKNKTVKSLYGSPNTYNLLGLSSGSWRNTNSLTSIKLYNNSGDFVQNCRFSLYGIRSVA